MEFPVAPSPHSPPTAPVPAIMRRVLYALTPAALVYIWFFGTGFVVNLIVAMSVILTLLHLWLCRR